MFSGEGASTLHIWLNPIPNHSSTIIPSLILLSEIFLGGSPISCSWVSVSSGRLGLWWGSIKISIQNLIIALIRSNLIIFPTRSFA
ncbi:hypothetical protein MKW98_013565 [Papaver atlanticum]|uniref:Uncharacterized protein n=1 Tax=Papaver atlanticum TaxID=357466 RepID=A0AAD4T3A7_9MAGN|nr:hypothetical protein MKW98_013565 [Papaver atlanticum]